MRRKSRRSTDRVSGTDETKTSIDWLPPSKAATQLHRLVEFALTPLVATPTLSLIGVHATGHDWSQPGALAACSRLPDESVMETCLTHGPSVTSGAELLVQLRNHDLRPSNDATDIILGDLNNEKCRSPSKISPP
jgi:hypothetical protein